MMNSWGRTESNRERLKLKSFFKKLRSLKSLPAIKSLKFENSNMKNAPLSSGASRATRRYVEGRFRWSRSRAYGRNAYRLKRISFTNNKKYWLTHREKAFNKPQLIGKVLRLDGEQYRIINKI